MIRQKNKKLWLNSDCITNLKLYFRIIMKGSASGDLDYDTEMQLLSSEKKVRLSRKLRENPYLTKDINEPLLKEL